MRPLEFYLPTAPCVLDRTGGYCWHRFCPQLRRAPDSYMPDARLQFVGVLGRNLKRKVAESSYAPAETGQTGSHQMACRSVGFRKWLRSRFGSHKVRRCHSQPVSETLRRCLTSSWRSTRTTSHRAATAPGLRNGAAESAHACFLEFLGIDNLLLPCLSWLVRLGASLEVATSKNMCENQLYPPATSPTRKAYLKFTNLKTGLTYCRRRTGMATPRTA